MCDTESSVYVPLLEETSFMPQHKYSYGPELRGHAERIASHYNLSTNGVFRTTIHTATWAPSTARWHLTLTEDRGPSQPPRAYTATSQFFVLCAGVLNHPKVPRIPGLDAYAGALLHTARWDYSVSGGAESAPVDDLTRLRGKRVGVIGTGATAVQAVPKLAGVAGELFVFQRTPSSVGVRGQQATDAGFWRAEIATGPGWQRAHRRNFELLTQGAEGVVADAGFTDGWTRLTTYTVLAGNAGAEEVGLAEVPAHVGRMVVADVPLMERVRRRVAEVVTDRATAAVLTPWYQTWCKRPGFHDEYLQAFNRPNVHVVDTSESKGALRASRSGLAVGEDGEEIPLDVIILATGFRSPGAAGDPGVRAGVAITGRDGGTLAEKWATKGAGTLHGIASAGFPNFFMQNVYHAASSPNFTSALGRFYSPPSITQCTLSKDNDTVANYPSPI